MPRALLDENVSLQVGRILQALGYEVITVAHHAQRGMDDEAVFALVTEQHALLVTRDAHFTNPLRFPPQRTAGILFITPGNLRGDEEAALVDGFLKVHPPTIFAGCLVLLSPAGVVIR